jgi:hypothetical protein
MMSGNSEIIKNMTPLVKYDVIRTGMQGHDEQQINTKFVLILMIPLIGITKKIKKKVLYISPS